MKYLLIVLFFFISVSITAQNWAVTFNLDNPVSTFYEDSSSDELFFGGSFSHINNETIVGIAKWNGSSISTLGCGVEWDCITPGPVSTLPVNGIIRFSNQIYVIGNFTKAGNKTVNGITYWNGINWENFGTGLKMGDGTHGIGIRLKIINSELYICGVFDSIEGISANSIGKYDGSNWSAVHNFPVIPTDIGAKNRINDIAFYNNELYVCGNLNNLPIGTIFNIVKWDGADWVSVGGGIRGSIVFVNKMLVYNNELIVAGLFSKNDDPNNPGNNIAKWDGIQWSELGEGVDGMIHDMKVYKDTLYVCGAFKHAGGVPADGIAKWDGSKWCGFGTTFDNVVNTLDFYHDTLYIGGGFWTINGDSILFLAKWIGGNYVDTCGNATSVNEINEEENAIIVYPNPATTTLTISGNITNAAVQVFDISGKLLLKIIPDANQLDISHLCSGMYFLKLTTNEGSVVRKFVKQ